MVSIPAVSENKIIDWQEYFSVKQSNRFTDKTVLPDLLYPVINIEESYLIFRLSTVQTVLSKRLDSKFQNSYIRLFKNDLQKKIIKVVIFDEKKRKKKTLHIGQIGYQDYPQHWDDERKQRYIERHKKNENWNDFLTAGFWARFILWNKKTIRESIEVIEKRFNLKRI